MPNRRFAGAVSTLGGVQMRLPPSRVRFVLVATLGICGSWVATFAQTAAPAQAQPPAGTTRPGAPAIPPPRPATALKPPTGIVRGYVTAAIGGKPIVSAQVNLASAVANAPGPQVAATREVRTVATDAEGRFEIKDLPAGVFRVSAVKNGYVRLEFGQKAWNEPGSTIEVKDGQVVERIDFALQRGGVLVVTVTDRRGELMAGAMVQPMQWRFVNGRRQLLPSNSIPTNDLGQARLHGLAPGEYYVSVSPPFGTVGAANARQSYTSTYYPGTFMAEEAQRVPVAVAQETSISVPLVRSRMSTITGRAVKSDGSPVAYTPLPPGSPQGIWGVLLRQYNPGGGFSQRDVPTKADGSFSISNLLPGTYAIQVRPVGNLRAFLGYAEFANVPITVAGDDVENLTVVSQRGAWLQGKIIFDTGAPPTDKTPDDLRVTAYSTTVEPPLSTGLVTMHPDWTWDIPGLVLTGMVRLAATDTGWSTKAVIVDGKDIVEAPIAFEMGRDYKDVQLVLTQKRAEVTGAAVDGGGRPVKNYVALLFPQERDRWFPRSLSILTARPDQNGQFKMSKIPGAEHGSYYIIAIDSLEPGAEMDFELLARLAPKADRITLGETEIKNVSLRLQEGR